MCVLILTIIRGLQNHEQTTGPSQLLTSMRILITFLKINNLANRMERLTFKYKREVSHHDKIVRGILVPHLKSRIAASEDESTKQKTVIDVAVKEVKDGKQKIDADFIEISQANLRVFLFAGHDTTGQGL